MFNEDEQRLRSELPEVWDLVRDRTTEIPEAVREAVASALANVGRPERIPGRQISEGLADRADPFALSRFVDAQEAGGTYRRALFKLRAGRKTTHWMWCVFPQIAGLDRSRTSRLYAISTSTRPARSWLIRSWGHQEESIRGGVT